MHLLLLSTYAYMIWSYLIGRYPNYVYVCIVYKENSNIVWKLNSFNHSKTIKLFCSDGINTFHVSVAAKLFYSHTTNNASIWLLDIINSNSFHLMSFIRNTLIRRRRLIFRTMSLLCRPYLFRCFRFTSMYICLLTQLAYRNTSVLIQICNDIYLLGYCHMLLVVVMKINNSLSGTYIWYVNLLVTSSCTKELSNNY